MGEARRDALRVGFDRAIKLEFHGAKVSSDAGLFPYRDLDEAAQLTDSGAAELFNFPHGHQRSTRHGGAAASIRHGCNCMRWRTTRATSCAGWRCRRV